MKRVYSYLYPTTEESIRWDKHKTNEWNYNLFKETFTNLKFILNKSLYNTLMRYRKEYEQQYGRGSFYFYTINRYFDNRLCTQLKRLLIAYNHDFRRLCIHNKHVFYTMLTAQQRYLLFDPIINNNDFVLFAFFQI